MKLVNLEAQTELAAGISAGDTSLTVENSAALDPPFRVWIDDEMIMVRERSGNTYSDLLRGLEGTLAADHEADACVIFPLVGVGATLSASALLSVLARTCHVQHEVAAGGNGIFATNVGEEPSPAFEGNLDFYLNGMEIVRYDESVVDGSPADDAGGIDNWIPWGPIFPFTRPRDPLFSWVNQGGASIDISRGGIHLIAPTNNGQSLRMRVMSLVETDGGFDLTIAMLPLLFSIASQSCGIVIRESGSGKLITLQLRSQGPGPLDGGSAAETETSGLSDLFLEVWKHDAPDSPNAAYFSQSIPTRYMFLRVVQTCQADSDRLFFMVSANGQHWETVFSAPRSEFLTADQVGFFANDESSFYKMQVSLLHWLLTEEACAVSPSAAAAIRQFSYYISFHDFGAFPITLGHSRAELPDSVLLVAATGSPLLGAPVVPVVSDDLGIGFTAGFGAMPIFNFWAGLVNTQTEDGLDIGEGDDSIEWDISLWEATASSYLNSNYSPDKAIDRTFLSLYHSAIQASFPINWDLQFVDTLKTFDAIQITPRGDINDLDTSLFKAFPTDIEIYKSSNGVSWTLVDTFNGIPVDMSKAILLPLSTSHVTEYLRISVTGSTSVADDGGKKYVAFSEVRVGTLVVAGGGLEKVHVSPLNSHNRSLAFAEIAGTFEDWDVSNDAVPLSVTTTGVTAPRMLLCVVMKPGGGNIGAHPNLDGWELVKVQYPNLNQPTIEQQDWFFKEVTAPGTYGLPPADATEGSYWPFGEPSDPRLLMSILLP